MLGRISLFFPVISVYHKMHALKLMLHVYHPEKFLIKFHAVLDKPSLWTDIIMGTARTQLDFNPSTGGLNYELLS